MAVEIWYRDPIGVFLDADNAVLILPERGTTLTEQLNALMRFALYLAILLTLFRQSVTPGLFVLSAAAIVTSALHYHDRERDAPKEELMERLNVRLDENGEEYCTQPSKSNPFMNVMPSEYAEFPTRPPACDVTLTDVKKDIDLSFSRRLFRDSDDIYGRDSGSARQFYTMPVTTIPNDQESFAKWLYRDGDIDGVCRDGDMIACSSRMTARRPGM
jgi:hypothetical protein